MKCRLVRFWAGWRTEESPTPPPFLKKHLFQCRDCDAWLRSRRELISRLRRTTPLDAAPEPPPFLRAKILRVIHDDPLRQTSWREGWIPPLARSAATLAAGALALLFALQSQKADPSKPPKPVVVENTVTVPPGPSLPVIPDSSANPDSQLLWQAAVQLEQPLQREMILLKEDALTALYALRTGFVPENLIEEWKKLDG